MVRQRRQHCTDVGARARVDAGERVDQAVRGRVRDELRGDLLGDPASGGGVVGEVLQVGLRHCLAVGGGVGVAEAEDLDSTGGVGVDVVLRFVRLAPVDRVAGQEHGRRLDHRLRVARRATDGVQLQQLAALVLVRLALHRLPVVEVGAHRRMQRAGDEQVLEPAERVAADGGVVVVAVDPGAVMAHGDVHVVGPELGHGLEHGPLGVDPAQDAPVPEVVAVLPRLLAGARVGRCLLGRRAPQVREPAVDVGDLAASGTLAGASCASSQASGVPAARSLVSARWVNPVPNRFRNSRSREVAASAPVGAVFMVQKDEALYFLDRSMRSRCWV